MTNPRAIAKAMYDVSSPRPVDGRRSHVTASSLGGTRSGKLSAVYDAFRLLLVLLIIVTISRVHLHFPVLASLRPALLLVIASAGYAFLNPKSLTRANVLRLWPMRCIAVLGVLACCSAVFGISLGASALFILDDYWKTLLLTLLVAVAIRNARDLYTLIWAYVISSGIICFFALFVFDVSKSRVSYVTRLSDLYTYDANDIDVVLSVGLALTLLLLQVGGRGRRALLWANVLAILATIARSGSRGGFIGLVAMGLAALVWINSVSVVRRLAIAITAVGVLVVGAPPGYWQQMHTIISPSEDYNYSSTTGRKAILLRGLGYVSKYPVFGVGISNFGRAECTIPRPEEYAGPVHCMAPHNSFLQAAAETGIPGFLVWASLPIGGIISLFRWRRRLPRAWRTGTETERFLYASTHYMALGLFGFAVTAAFVSFAWLQIIYLCAAYVVGVQVAIRAYCDEQRLAHGWQAPMQQARGWRVIRSAETARRMTNTLPSQA